MREFTSHTEQLHPVRFRPPHLRPLLRYAVVAALLATAAAVLMLDRPAAPARPAACRVATSASPIPSGSTALPVPAGLVGVPVQLAEPATAAVLRPGDRVDVVARTSRPAATPDRSPTSENSPSPGPPTSTVLARDVLVLSVNADSHTSPDAVVIYLAMKKDHAERVSSSAPDVAMGITVRPR